LSLCSNEPKIIPKEKPLIEGTEDLILSLYTKGLSVRDIRAHSHFDDLYGYELSIQTISNITDKIIDVAKEWHVVKRGQSRPLEPIYPIIFLTESAKAQEVALSFNTGGSN